MVNLVLGVLSVGFELFRGWMILTLENRIWELENFECECWGWTLGLILISNILFSYDENTLACIWRKL